ncbi:MAG: preQ(1) synthase [Acidimicrobiales bacterium]
MSALPPAGDQKPSTAAPAAERQGVGRGDDDPGAGLSILGNTVRHPVEHVECFPAPAGCSRVRFSTEELMSICPVTGQPDLSAVVIDYIPGPLCIESKSLKLFLWSFRDRAIFAEALAAAIADEVVETVQPRWVKVTVTQRPRGGIEIQTTSEFGDPAAPTTS